MADRIVVLRNGRLEQVGTPLEIYRRPASPFVAGFIGVMNFVDGIVSGPQEIRCGSMSLRTPPVAWPKGAKVICAFRAEHLRVEQAGDAADNVFLGSVADAEYLGSYLRLYVKSPLSGELRADVDAASADQPGMAPGATVSLRVSPEYVHVYPAEGA